VRPTLWLAAAAAAVAMIVLSVYTMLAA